MQTGKPAHANARRTVGRDSSALMMAPNRRIWNTEGLTSFRSNHSVPKAGPNRKVNKSKRSAAKQIPAPSR